MKLITKRPRTGSNRLAPNHCGFTLVELLIVIALLGLLAGMVSASYQGVANASREARTRSIIATIDSVIQEKYESYKYRPLPVEIPDMFQPGNQTGTEVGFETLATEASRIRLMMSRDLQKMEMPDRWSDIVVGTGDPVRLRAAVSPVVTVGGNVVGARSSPASRRMMNVSWFGIDRVNTNTADSANVPSQLAAYRSRVTTVPTVEHQGAECLFLIMSTSFVGGTPAIDAIPDTNIGDTDGDLMPEILDGWGRPLMFVRWPVGYVDPSGVVDRTTADDFDLFRSDYAYADTGSPPVSSAQATSVEGGGKVRPWSIRPLIASAGSDGEFGISANPWNSASELTAFDYRSQWGWAVDADHYGSELPGRGAGIGAATHTTHPFPDPYLRNFVANNQSSGVFVGRLPGQVLPTSTALEDRVDNMTNYDLQADN
ncbi:type II secretion system protein [Planctomycetes bacterium K23_9]|uniref:Type II secretion system protein G n=1 Tax=Stieleria marina TaxID=1930275 RepID=A0A517NQR9_9BACT|nr:hypothetical protein K239x_14130 [Planctomycetes bacterium K23_9]